MIINEFMVDFKQTEAYGITLFVIALTTLLTTVVGFLTLFFGWRKIRESRNRIKIKLETTFIFKSETELKQLRYDTIYKNVFEFYNYLLNELTGTASNSSFLFFTLQNRKNKFLRKKLGKAVDLVDSFLIKYDYYKNVLENEKDYDMLIKELNKRKEVSHNNYTFLEFRADFFNSVLLLAENTRNTLKEVFDWKIDAYVLKKGRTITESIKKPLKWKKH